MWLQKNCQRRAVLLTLNMEKGTMSQWMWTASRSWKNRQTKNPQRNRFSPSASRRNQPCWHLDNLQNFNIINLCFKPLSLWLCITTGVLTPQSAGGEQVISNWWHRWWAMTSGGSRAGDGKRPSELIGPWFLRRVGYRKVITSLGYRVSEGPRSGPMEGAGFTGCPHTHIAHLWILKKIVGELLPFSMSLQCLLLRKFSIILTVKEI